MDRRTDRHVLTQRPTLRCSGGLPSSFVRACAQVTVAAFEQPGLTPVGGERLELARDAVDSLLARVPEMLREPTSAALHAIDTLGAALEQLHAAQRQIAQLVANRAWLDAFARALMDGLGRVGDAIDGVHVNVTALVNTTIADAQDAIEGAASTGFAMTMVSIVVCAVPVVCAFVRPGARIARSLLVSGCAVQWVQGLIGCAIGGGLLAAALAAMDVCEVAADFSEVPGAYLEHPLVANVTEACLLSPSKPVVGLLAAHLGEGNTLAAAKQLLALGLHFGVNLPLAEWLERPAARVRELTARVERLQWRDFGLSETRAQLLDRCCSHGGSTNHPTNGGPSGEGSAEGEERGSGVIQEQWDAACDDDAYLRRACDGAREVLDANATVRQAMDASKTRAKEINDAVYALERSAGELSTQLARAGRVLEPLQSALGQLDSVGDCSFARRRYAALQAVACEGVTPSLFWMAAALSSCALPGLIFCVLLLQVVHLSRLHAQWDQLARDDEAPPEGAREDDDAEGAGADGSDAGGGRTSSADGGEEVSNVSLPAVSSRLPGARHAAKMRARATMNGVNVAGPAPTPADQARAYAEESQLEPADENRQQVSSPQHITTTTATTTTWHL